MTEDEVVMKLYSSASVVCSNPTQAGNETTNLGLPLLKSQPALLNVEAVMYVVQASTES
jgi:hypothetical protein